LGNDVNVYVHHCYYTCYLLLYIHHYYDTYYYSKLLKHFTKSFKKNLFSLLSYFENPYLFVL